MTKTGELKLIEQEEVQTDLRELFRGAVKVALEAALEEAVVELVGARRGARDGRRKDVRNGSYLRGLVTSMGYMKVAVPRTRESGSASEVIGRYKRARTRWTRRSRARTCTASPRGTCPS